MRTLIEVLRDNAVHTDRSVTFVRSNGEELSVSYPDLWLTARKRAHALRSLGLARGDRVALILPDPDEFVLTFLAALTAGIVAVPMYPPQTLAKLEAYGDTVRHVLAASGARAVVTTEALRGMLEEHLLAGGGVKTHGGVRVVLEREIHEADGFDPDADWSVELDETAFLQFTSGSTSSPKGVMVTFRNLAVNSHAIMFDGLRSTPEDRGVSWLPLYHDMGLIGFVIAPLYALVQVMFLPTTAFIRRPSIWLDAIHRFRGTITFAPNFAYALATRAVTETQAAGWDLSCMRALGCGAEPIQAEVLRGFLTRFAKNGLRPESILPSYGMAEATLAITFSDIDATLTTDRVDLMAMRAGMAKPAADGAAAALELVACGRSFPGHEISVVAPDGTHLEDRQVGEVWLRGPSVTVGYFNEPASTEDTFGGGWLRTGDLGYLADGQLYICGRAKDLIILGGKNYYPQDVERIVSRVDGIRDGQCVAFSRLDASGGEQAVVVAECRKSTPELSQAVMRAVRAEVGVQLAEVILIKRGTLAKTSSGKVRRREMKRRLETGELELAVAEDKGGVAPPPVPSRSGVFPPLLSGAS
ncbi:fatty acyl-AMP ligase [Chondromyces crocatus]|uniref:Acyl-CoA synthetase n=1 Tax=Chondromyces crocatus TaxID=52 RepID=A0A0K1EMR5_CHOCO|nr:fatty acyl-AMP ligase [Chondromyces crocatus]AKT41947.1 acyl-CoA synthetase [Chondromyces crocatus]